MKRYDNAVKALCEVDPGALCRLLGVPVVAGAAVNPSSGALPASPREVDALLVVDASTAIHVEFQVAPESGFGYRMLEYRARLARAPRLAGRSIEQHAVLLGPGRLDGGVSAPRLSYSYAVHHLADVDAERLLQDPATAPFATLGRVGDGDRAGTLRRALDVIAGHRTGHTLALLWLAVDLARLRIDRSTIDTIVKEALMPIPSLMNEFVEEWLQEGREEGRLDSVAALLRARFGDDSRVTDIARRLITLDAEACARRILDAGSLDDLT